MQRRSALTPVILGFLAVLAIYYFGKRVAGEEKEQTVSYAELLDMVDTDRIEKLRFETDRIVAEVAESEHVVETPRLPGIEERELLEALRAHDVDFTGKVDENSLLIASVLSWLIPIGILFAIWFFMAKRVSDRMGGKGGPLSFARSKAKLYDETRQTGVTFTDVAGVHEAVDEMRDTVDFLRTPRKYLSLGAKIPKGVLLVGAPGTGKTLLARAVAGEAGVPFFSMTGADFVEMFVGVGAARVRDLFQRALQLSPCIVFIDEIDAIGKSRSGVTVMATHDEREQTLNQLLSEMDGFDPKAGVVIIAATNRPEVLDRALVRSGRFDRQVIIDPPSRPGREEILAVHARNVPIARDVDFGVIARRTPGMVGADLAKVVNEAALAAARRGSVDVEHTDFETAIDRIQLGLEKRSRPISDEEKRRIAYHEAGHALAAISVKHADPVHRVTIIPRSVGALGATLQLPTDDRHLLLRSELIDRICVLLGGRCAERLTFDDVSTGAEDDLQKATETARLMVCRFGMSTSLGPRSLSPFPAGERSDPLLRDRGYSDERARAIDDEIDHILEEQEARALAILEEREEILHRIVGALLEEETIDGEALTEMVRRFEDSRRAV